MIKFIVEYYDWLAIAAFVPVWIVVAEIEGRILKLLHVDLEKYVTIFMTTSMVLSGGVVLGAGKIAEPFLREECCRARVTEWLTKSSPYATLVEHHPEAKTALINAFTKMGMGGNDAIVGKSEMSEIVNHYLRHYLPVTSDRAAREFVMAATGLVDEALKSEPELCVAYLNGHSLNLSGRVPTHVLARYGNAIGGVITDGIRSPQPAPDSGLIRWQRQKVAEQMKRDGNPLAIDPQRVRSDPNRACFALLAVMHAVGTAIPETELGGFFRGTAPDYLKENGA